MAVLKCEICGGKIVSSSKDGWFLCDNCGIEYPLEWMRAKFKETVTIEGPIKIDGVANTENLLLRVEQFYSTRQYERANDYCERLLDVDATNERALELSILIKRDRIADYFSKIEQALASGLYSEAKECYQQILFLEPNNAQARSGLNDITAPCKVGDILLGTVTRIMPFGAFVDLPNGQKGMVHISKLESKRVDNIGDTVRIGDRIFAKVIQIGSATAIDLSRKDAIMEMEALQDLNLHLDDLYKRSIAMAEEEKTKEAERIRLDEQKRLDQERLSAQRRADELIAERQKLQQREEWLNQGRCVKCGGQLNLFGKCKSCGEINK